MFNGFYNPYFQSSYPVYNCQRQHARAEALLAQRARRAQYLPHEELGLREHLYLEARRQQALDNERRRRDEAAERYQQQLEELRRSHREHVQRKQQAPNDRRYNRGATDATYRQEPATSTRTTQVPSKGSSSRPPTPPVEYSDVHHRAAQQIQGLYRQRRSLHSIDNVISQFQETRNSFMMPEGIDFINSSVRSTAENVITVDTTLYVTNSGVNISGPSTNIEANAIDTEHSDVAPSKAGVALRDHIYGTNAIDDETLNGTSQAPGPTTLSADDEFVIVKDDESSNTPSEASEPTIACADGEFVVIDEDQSCAAAQEETTTVEMVTENRESANVESTAAITDDAEKQSEETVDDVDPGESTCRLAYTTRNYPLHAYIEKLNVLLTKLDGIDSYGSQNVRDRRKEAARAIEKEAGRIELVVKDAWRKQSRA